MILNGFTAAHGNAISLCMSTWFRQEEVFHFARFTVMRSMLWLLFFEHHFFRFGKIIGPTTTPLNPWIEAALTTQLTIPQGELMLCLAQCPARAVTLK